MEAHVAATKAAASLYFSVFGSRCCLLLVYSSLKMPFYRLQMAAMLMKPSQKPTNNTYLPTTTINGTTDCGSLVSHFQ